MNQKQLLKRVLIVTLSIVGGLTAVAIVLGVLNAVVADGEWTFGWNDYRYDETGYQLGSGTIPFEEISNLEIDWIDGEVNIVACNDMYISVSEQAEESLHESLILRWRVSDDGGTLSVRYRNSSYYFGIGNESRNKVLTVRIPEKLFEHMENIKITVGSSNVMVQNIRADSLTLDSVSGHFIAENCQFADFSAETVSGALVYNGTVEKSVEIDSVSGEVLFMGESCPEEVDIETVSSDITLSFPSDVSMTVDWEGGSGRLTSDIALTQNGELYVAGDGLSLITAESIRGDLKITEAKQPK